MAELPLVFFILLFLFIFPLINLCGICLGACTVYLTTLQVVGRTSKQLDFPKALTAFEEEANTSNGSPLMTFLKTHPVGGYKGTGNDLFITATDTGATTNPVQYGPNAAMPGPVDANKIYEYSDQATYDIEPFLNMGFVPFIGSVPALGAPYRLTLTAHRAVEQTAGLVVAAAPPSLSGGGAGPNLNDPPGLDPASVAASGGTTWNNPTVFDTLDNTGQTVVDQTVLSVAANNPDWTHTSVNCNAGDKIYVDYKADGFWNVGTELAKCDADGTMATCYDGSVNKIGYMVGKLGATQFYMGKAQQMYLAPTGQAGELLIANYDKGDPESTDPKVRKHYKKQKGTMDVRIVVVR